MSKTAAGIILYTLMAICNAEGTDIGSTGISNRQNNQDQKTAFIHMRNVSERFTGIVKVSPYDADVDFPCQENYGTNSLWGRCNNLHFIDFDIESGNFPKNSTLDTWYLFIYKGFGNPNSEGGCDWISEEINKPSPFIPRHNETETIFTEPSPNGFPYNKHRCDVISSIKLTDLMKGATKMVAYDEEIVGNSVAIVNNKKEIIGCAPILPRLHSYWVALGNESFNSTKSSEGNTFVIASLPCSQLRIFSDIDICSNAPGTKENQEFERMMQYKWAFAKNCNEPVEVPSCGVFVNTVRKSMDISNEGRYDLGNEHRYVTIWSDECDAKPTCLELKRMSPWQFSSTLFDNKHKKNVDY